MLPGSKCCTLFIKGVRQTERKRARLHPSSIWPWARDSSNPGRRRRESGRVGREAGHTSGANISLAGSPGHGGGQGSAGEGEDACLAVNYGLTFTQQMELPQFQRHSFARTHAHTPFVSASTLGSSAHANAGSETGMEGGGEGKAGGYLLEWLHVCIKNTGTTVV